jgi:beta-alanine--pyruvate transaminase
MDGPADAIELFHGYTYSGHPLASAAAVASLELYREEDLFARAASLSQYFEGKAHGLKGAPNVIDVRNLGLMAGIELAARPGKPGTRAYDVFVRCYEKGVLIRVTGDIIALSPPLIVEKAEIDRIFETIREALGVVT